MKAKAKLPLGEIFSPNRWNLFCQQMKSPPDFSRRSQMDSRQCSASQTDRGTRKCQMARDNIVRGGKTPLCEDRDWSRAGKKVSVTEISCCWTTPVPRMHGPTSNFVAPRFFCRKFVNHCEKSVSIYTNLRDEVDCSGVCEFAETIWQLQRPLTE